MKKETIKDLAGFLAVLTLCLMVAAGIVVPKDNSPYGGMENYQNWGFLSEKKGSIDVYVVGNSDAGAAWSPMEAWKDQGFTSYVSSGTWQNMAQAYHLFHTAVKYHHPKLVIFETDQLFTHKDNLGTSVFEELFPLLKYHDRWKETSLSDLFRKTTYQYGYAGKGQTVRNTAIPYTGKDNMTADSGTESIPAAYLGFLNQMVSECRKEGIQLMLIDMPTASSWNMKRHNTVQKYADAHGLKFMDMNIKSDAYAVNWTMDTRDGGDHLNWYGASKLTRYVSSVIAQEYSLPDHRKDTSYSKEWSADYASYLKEVQLGQGY